MTSYKIHTRRPVPPQEWVVCENAHLPLVSGEEFQQVQTRLGKRRYTGRNGEHLLSGLVFCKECGGRMYPHRVGKYSYFVCGTYARNAPKCSAHRLREEVLERLVIGRLRSMVSAALDPEETAARLLSASEGEIPDLDGLQKKLDRLAAQRRQAYADRLEGLIDGVEYAAASARLRQREQTLRRQWEQIRSNTRQPDRESFAKRIRAFLALEQPDRAFVGELIRGIFVGESGRVEIRFSFLCPK